MCVIGRGFKYSMATGPQPFGGDNQGGGGVSCRQRVKWATRSSSAIKQAVSFNEVLSFYNGVGVAASKVALIPILTWPHLKCGRLEQEFSKRAWHGSRVPKGLGIFLKYHQRIYILLSQYNHSASAVLICIRQCLTRLSTS